MLRSNTRGAFQKVLIVLLINLKGIIMYTYYELEESAKDFAFNWWYSNIDDVNLDIDEPESLAYDRFAQWVEEQSRSFLSDGQIDYSIHGVNAY